jgi:malate dehydrogenase (oxaloacetate-decarboxylating)(NADP+)
VGTNNRELLSDPAYMGLRRERERGPEYDELIAEFFAACQDAYGRSVLLQFEDFGNLNAFRLLETFRNDANCFNDDIQGTASVSLAGLIASLPLTKKTMLSDHTYLFYG